MPKQNRAAPPKFRKRTPLKPTAVGRNYQDRSEDAAIITLTCMLSHWPPATAITTSSRQSSFVLLPESSVHGSCNSQKEPGFCSLRCNKAAHTMIGDSQTFSKSEQKRDPTSFPSDAVVLNIEAVRAPLKPWHPQSLCPSEAEVLSNR